MKRKRRSVLKSVIQLLVVLSALCISAYFIIAYINTPQSVRYPEFGIDIPLNYSIHGIDVSRFQGVIDWEDVKAMNVKDIRIRFAYMKATEGVDDVDDQFRRNWLEAEEYDLPKGAYHYFIAGKSGTLQAKNFISIVRLKRGDLPPVLDIEKANSTDAETIKKEIAEWLNAVQLHYHITPIIYSNIDFYNKYVKGFFDTIPFWVSHYLQPQKPRIDRKWIFWQHSENGHVDGVRTTVDFNVFYGDSTEFRDLLLK